MSDRAQRRLAAIVAADVAGYSRLVGVDEEGTLRALRAHRQELIDPLLAAHGGRVANTAGDSLLLEFPSVVDAVRCSMDIQRGMAVRNADIPQSRRIGFRIGINLGDVVSAGDDLLGDGVNVAARLEALANPGGICLSRAARDQVRDRLDVDLEDLGEVEVKNIARPVRVFRIVDGTALPGKARRVEAAHAGRWARPPIRHAAFVALLVLALAALGVFVGVAGRGGLAALWPGEDSTEMVAAAGAGVRPALVVLPFANLSGDPSQEYFGDGLTEDLTTALARIPGLLVTARNTAFTFKGRSVDARSVGAELGVRYLLEGSVRKFGDRLRLNAQLIETQNGTHVWAESYDRPLKDLFVVQDELIDRIAGSVTARLRRREGERALSASPGTLAAYDLTSRARLLFRQNTLESITEARELLHRAIEQDPKFAGAYSYLAQVENFFFTSRISDEYANMDTAQRVVEAASKATALAPDDAFAHAVYGISLRVLGDYDQALREAQRARELAPNDPDVLTPIAVVMIGAGDYEVAAETVLRAWKLDPYINPLSVGVILSQAQFALGDFAASRESAEFCLKVTPNDVRCLESLVRALGELGPPDEAKAAVADLLRLSPDYTVSEYRRRAEKNRRDHAAIARWAEGLRKAGLPE